MNNGGRMPLIGVDTRETKHPRKPVEHFGKEAAAFTKRMVEGKRVRLEFDPANAPRAHKEIIHAFYREPSLTFAAYCAPSCTIAQIALMRLFPVLQKTRGARESWCQHWPAADDSRIALRF